MSVLSGRRIVITRARHQSGPFAAALEARGAQPLFFPTIMIRPVEDSSAVDAAVGALADYAWIVFTSANAVAAFWDRMEVNRLSALPSGMRVASIGPATSEELTSRGVVVDAQPGIHTGAAIAGTMGGELDGARVLVPRALVAREETVRELRQAGARVDEVVVYHTESELPDEATLRPLRDGVDAITFASPSAVRGFASLLGADAGRITGATVLATIGPTTSGAVRAAGWPEPVEASVATADGIVSALERHFASAGALR